jgi:hypothetical protein
MKRETIVLAALIAAIVIAVLQSYSPVEYSPMYASQAPPGYSGDPAGGNKSCVNCHSGHAAMIQTGWITSDIPVSGYLPLTDYSITATATRIGHTKFGFQVTPQNNNGTFLGTLANIGTDTKLTSNPNYITHNQAAIAGNGSKSWVFKWTSPIAGSGPVTFYGAFNATNANNYSSGDSIFLSTLSVNESTTGIDENQFANAFLVYPNPSKGKFEIQFQNFRFSQSAKLEIYNLSGQLIYQSFILAQKTTIELGKQNKGIYLLKVYFGDKEITEKILIE